MKKNKLLVLLTLLVAFFAFLPQRAHAQVDQAWDKKTFIYGGGLSDSQIQETSRLLGIEDMNQTENFAITGDDFQRYLGYSTSTSNLISSITVEKRRANSGVEVVIDTPQNITQITEQQYSNAAITAGATDVSIHVASVNPATGESALTGVYKAFEVNGEALDPERMQVAQEELETTNEIAQNLDEEQAQQLDQAIVDIKQQLADIKDQTGQLASREDIERIINEALEKYNLGGVVNNIYIEQLIILFEKYQNTGAIDSEEVRASLNNLSEDLKQTLGEAWTRAEESGLIDQIVAFFTDLFNSIRAIFTQSSN